MFEVQSVIFFVILPPNYIYFDVGGKQSLISKQKSELESLEVQICGEIHHFSQKNKLKIELKNFSLREKKMFPPYLVPTMSGGFHAKESG